MKIYRVVLLFAVSFCLVSCGNNEEEQRIFWVQLSNQANTSSSDNWVIVRDQYTGDVLGFEMIESGEVKEFKTSGPLPSSVSVTYFVKNQSTEKYTADVYMDIPTASAWYINPLYELAATGPAPGADLGYYDLTINSVPSINAYGISDNKGINFSLFSFISNQVIAKGLTIRQGSPQHVVCIDPGTASARYAIITDLADKKDQTLDYSSFKEFDKTMNISFPTTKNMTLQMSGYAADQSIGGYGYSLFRHYLRDGVGDKSSVSLGFLNSIPKYKIDLTVSDNFIYKLRGAAPLTPIEYVSSSAFEISDKSFSAFRVTSTQPYTFRIADFGYVDGSTEVHFNYHSKTGGKYYPALPDELMARYPMLSAAKVAFQSCRFTVRSQSYEDMILERFDGDPALDGPNEFERLQVVVK